MEEGEGRRADSCYPVRGRSGGETLVHPWIIHRFNFVLK